MEITERKVGREKRKLRRNYSNYIDSSINEIYNLIQEIEVLEDIKDLEDSRQFKSNIIDNMNFALDHLENLKNYTEAITTIHGNQIAIDNLESLENILAYMQISIKTLRDVISLNNIQTLHEIMKHLEIIYGKIATVYDSTLIVFKGDNSNKSNIQKESSLEVELKNKENEINQLKKDLKKSSSDNNDKEELEEIIGQLELSYSNIGEEIKLLKSNEKKVEETIDFIEKLPSEHLGTLKEKLERRITFFNWIGTISLIIASMAFVGYFYCLVTNIHAPTNAVAYFNNVFFIIFPTIVAFTSFRQSNLKSAELEKIDEKLLNSNYLVASLKAIQKISGENDTNEKILSSITKLIDNILKTKEENQEDKKEEKSLTAGELSIILKNLTAIAK